MLYLAFISALVGSLHCLVMCGPISYALPIDRRSKASIFLGVTFYNLGRITTYVLLGYIIGLLGYSLRWVAFQQWVSIIIGIIIIFSIIGWSSLLRKIQSSLLGNMTSKFGGLMRSMIKEHGHGGLLMAGMINGIIPCGMVYMAIGLALVQQTFYMGVLIMLVFGIGTVPVFYVVHFFGSSLKINRVMGTTVVKAFLFSLGLLFIYRGLYIDIPLIDDLLINTSLKRITLCR